MSAVEVLLGAGVVAALGLSAVTLRRQSAAPRPPRRLADSDAAGAAALRHVGVVRFNPYHDTGGEYSFAVALLSRTGDGVILTGLYHRDQCRVYAKPVAAWTSSYVLTDEERQAIGRARGEEESETGPADRL